jgi:hypothetical protein
MRKIFISYTHSDRSFARKITNDLRLHGHKVWIDESGINIGDPLIEKIRHALDSIDYVIVILSKASIKSEWMKRELDIAFNREIEEKRILILPIVIERPVKLPGFLKGKLYGDFSREDDYAEKLELLLRSLSNRYM